MCIQGTSWGCLIAEKSHLAAVNSAVLIIRTLSQGISFPPTLPSPARGEGSNIPSPGGRGKGEGAA
jgi:hypothetical protein